MQVGKAWDDQLIAHVNDFDVLVFVRKRGKSTCTDAIFTDHIGILHKIYGSGGQAVTYRTF